MRAKNLKKRVGKKYFQAVCIRQRYMKEYSQVYTELAQLLKDETSIIYVFTCDETKVIWTYK